MSAPGPTGDLAKDTATLQALVTAGQQIPAGHWCVMGPILYPQKGALIDAAPGCTIEYVQPKPGWASGFLFCSAGYPIAGRPRAQGLVARFGAGSQILIPDNGCTAPRKGFAVTDTDGFSVDGVRVNGPEKTNVPDTKQFAVQVHNSNGTAAAWGTISNAFAYVQASGQGADGFHLTGNCSYVRFSGCSSDSGDDASSATLELPSMPNCVIENIEFVDCSLNNEAHSVIKGLILPTVGAGSIIRHINYLRCDLKTTLAANGQGAPIWIENQGGLIDDIQINGGKLRVIVPTGGAIDGAAIHLKGVSSFKLQGTAIQHFSRLLLDATDCPDLLFNPLSVSTLGVVSKPAVMKPLVSLVGCDRPDIRTAALTPAYSGQALR